MKNKKAFEWSATTAVSLALVILLAIIILLSIPSISEAFHKAIKAVFG